MRILQAGIFVAVGLVGACAHAAEPVVRPAAVAGPVASASLERWLDQNASDRFPVAMRLEADEIVRREAWAPWPEATASGIVYRATASLPTSAEMCALVAATFVTRFGSELADHDVRRPVEVALACRDGAVKAAWTPAGGGKPARLALTVGDDKLEGRFDYTATPARPSGVDYELGLLATTPFEETPQRTLDYASATREDWFATHAGTAPVQCWPALWGGLGRQCVVRFPALTPRKCAALGLHAGYREAQAQVERGLSPRHSFELAAWCGESRAHLRFTRALRVEVEWFRADGAASELGTTIMRKKPAPLGNAPSERAAFMATVDERDKEHADRHAEALRRAGLVARWLGADGLQDLPGLLERVGRGLRCAENTARDALSPWSCQLAEPLPELATGSTCRTLAFAVAYVLPLAPKGPLAGRRELDATLRCDARGRVVRIERELDFITMTETQPEPSASSLSRSRDGTTDVWTAQLEALREVR